MDPCTSSSARPARPRPSRRQIVNEIEAYLREHAGEAIQVAHLCNATGVSERSLRNACQTVCGTSPKRFLLRQRLEAVRHELANAQPGQSTVTRIATDHGFFELGRFAATYTATFGERPSETLRSAFSRSRKPAA